MERTVQRPWFAWLCLALLAASCAVLAFLQNRWIAEISRAERTQLREGLRTSLGRFSQEFNRRVEGSLTALQPDDGEITRLGREEAYAEQYQRWKQSHENVFQRLALAVPAGGDVMRLLLLDPETGRFSPAEWSRDWSDIRARLEERASGRPGPMEPGGRAAVLELPRFGAREESGGRPGEQEWLLAELNLDYLKTSIFPAMLKQYLGATGTPEYDARVVAIRDPAAILYDSDAAANRNIESTADGSTDLLGIVPPIRRGRGDRGGPRKGGIREERRGGSPGTPRDPGGFGRRADLQDGGGPAFFAPGRGPGGNGGPGGPGRWRLFVRHRAGSLETIVARARTRNIVASFGILLLMLATAVILVHSWRQGQKLAELQLNFVAGVSHEFRTPLTVIRTAAYNLRGRLAHHADQVERYSKLIQEQSEKLTGLVEQVLRFAGTSNGQVIRDPSPVSVPELIDEGLLSSQAALEGSRITVDKQIPPELPRVLADELALRHAIQNLVDNAVKYGAGSSNWIGISAAAVLGANGPAVEIRVRDRGPGIPPEEQKHVFDAFFRGRRALEDQVHGTGLGLNLAKRIVEAHGGTLQLESKPGEGTEFVVTIPAVAPEKPRELAHSVG